MSDQISIRPEPDEPALREFEVKSPPTVHKYLQTLVDEENELYVYVGQDQHAFVTEILSLNADAGYIDLARPYDKQMMQHLSTDSRYVVVSFPEHIKIQFSGQGIAMANLDGMQVLRIQWPQLLLRLQRRNFFRVVADSEMMAHIRIDEPGYEGDYELVDLSQAGCAISVPMGPLEFQVGQTLNAVKLLLPDESHPVPVHLVVRNIKANPEDAQHLCLGCEMKLLQPRQEPRLQRFLLATERRQRAQRNAID